MCLVWQVGKLKQLEGGGGFERAGGSNLYSLLKIDDGRTVTAPKEQKGFPQDCKSRRTGNKTRAEITVEI